MQRYRYTDDALSSYVFCPDRYKGFALDFSPFSESSVNTFANFFKICVGIYVFLSAYGLTCSYIKWNNAVIRDFSLTAISK